MACSLLDQIVYLLSDVVLLTVLEFHAAEFVVDPLNDDLCRLVELLATLLFAFLATIFN